MIAAIVPPLLNAISMSAHKANPIGPDSPVMVREIDARFEVRAAGHKETDCFV